VWVSVDAGVVLLTGQLPGRDDIATAVALIDEIPGVIDIKDRLLCGRHGALRGRVGISVWTLRS
jgi:osmotically-inducible protein OsmY